MNEILEDHIVNNLNIIKSQFLYMDCIECVEKIENAKINLRSDDVKSKLRALKVVQGLSWSRIWDISDDSFIEPYNENSWYTFISQTVKKAKKLTNKIKTAGSKQQGQRFTFN